jgi:hypothetical protein
MMPPEISGGTVIGFVVGITRSIFSQSSIENGAGPRVHPAARQVVFQNGETPSKNTSNQDKRHK